MSKTHFNLPINSSEIKEISLKRIFSHSMSWWTNLRVMSLCLTCRRIVRLLQTKGMQLNHRIFATLAKKIWLTLKKTKKTMSKQIFWKAILGQTSPTQMRSNRSLIRTISSKFSMKILFFLQLRRLRQDLQTIWRRNVFRSHLIWQIKTPSKSNGR